jgi:transporter family-2 protein
MLLGSPGSRAVVRRWPRDRVRWWFCLGGLGGAALVSSSAAAAPVIGVALLSVCTVAGQTGGSLAVDEVGLTSGGRRPITPWRIAGALVAVAALAVGAFGRTHGGASPALYAALAGSGVLVAGQQAVNGRLREATGSASVAGTVSFLGGTAALGCAVGVLAATGAYGGIDWPGEPWLYLGGAGGAIYITLGAATVTVLGVLRLTLASVAGQLAGSVVLDLVVPTGGEHLTRGTLTSVLLTFVAVALVGRTERSRT